MKRKKGNADRLTAGVWWSRNRWSCVILAAALVLFVCYYPALSGLPIADWWADLLNAVPSFGFY